MRRLRDDLKAGRPGGKPLQKLSEIARRTKTGRLKKNQTPLYRLAKLLRYNVTYFQGDLQMYFGFVGTRRRRLENSWKQLLLAHEQGTDVLYSKSRTLLGRRLARIGGRLKKKGDPDAKFFFLRKNTGRRAFGTPQRSMIDAHWQAHQNEAQRNISRNFRRKMAGQHI